MVGNRSCWMGKSTRSPKDTAGSAAEQLENEKTIVIRREGAYVTWREPPFSLLDTIEYALSLLSHYKTMLVYRTLLSLYVNFEVNAMGKGHIRLAQKPVFASKVSW